ncbi:hypothetical protein F5148DRAFT_1366693 [Russula earlei]|uniref:Uncharacterized protein n=1 Tax=Russula earlei TaxID=71964 RepID=A0ACC0UFT7_9AGAM|nr:hypothetical protein F5148DRAFT_1366693 [Russula earlei]
MSESPSPPSLLPALPVAPRIHGVCAFAIDMVPSGHPLLFIHARARLSFRDRVKIDPTSKRAVKRSLLGLEKKREHTLAAGLAYSRKTAKGWPEGTNPHNALRLNDILDKPWMSDVGDPRTPMTLCGTQSYEAGGDKAQFWWYHVDGVSPFIDRLASLSLRVGIPTAILDQERDEVDSTFYHASWWRAVSRWDGSGRGREIRAKDKDMTKSGRCPVGD